MGKRGRKCSICTHDKVRRINALCVSGIPLREIASMFGLSYTALRRHYYQHVLQAQPGEFVDQLVDRVARAILEVGD